MKKFFKNLGRKSPSKGPPSGGSPKLGASGRQSGSTSSLIGYDVKEKELGKLHKAAWLNDIPKVRQLAKKDSSCLDKENRTPLHLACARGNAEVVEVLLEWKAKTNVGDNNAKTPLMKAVEGCHVDCVSQLVENRADVDTQDKDGNTALHLACMAGESNIIQLLVNKRAKLDTKNKEGLAPVHYALMAKNEEQCRLLLRAGADVNSEDMAGRTCLMKACQEGSINLVKIFLEFDADTGHKDTKGWTADDCAVIQGHHACSQLISDHNVRQNMNNRTPASTPRSSLPPSLAATPRDKSSEFGVPALDAAEVSVEKTPEFGCPAVDTKDEDSADETVSKSSELGGKGASFEDSWGDDSLSLAVDDKKPKRQNSSDIEGELEDEVVGGKVSLAKFIPDSDEGESSRASKMARLDEEGDDVDEVDHQESPLKKRNSTKSLQSNTSWEEDSSWSIQEPKKTRVSFKKGEELNQIHNISVTESEEDHHSSEGKPVNTIASSGPLGSYVPTGMSNAPVSTPMSADKQRAPGNKNAFLEDLGINDADDISDADVSEMSGADAKRGGTKATDDDSDWDTSAMSDPASTPRPGILKNWHKQDNVAEEDEDMEAEEQGGHGVNKPRVRPTSSTSVDGPSDWDSTTAEPAIREDRPPPLPTSPVPQKVSEWDSSIEEGILPDQRPLTPQVEAMLRQRQIESQDTDEELDDLFESDEASPVVSNHRVTPTSVVTNDQMKEPAMVTDDKLTELDRMSERQGEFVGQIKIENIKKEHDEEGLTNGHFEMGDNLIPDLQDGKPNNIEKAEKGSKMLDKVEFLEQNTEHVIDCSERDLNSEERKKTTLIEMCDVEDFDTSEESDVEDLPKVQYDKNQNLRNVEDKESHNGISNIDKFENAKPTEVKKDRIIIAPEFEDIVVGLEYETSEEINSDPAHQYDSDPREEGPDEVVDLQAVERIPDCTEVLELELIDSEQEESMKLQPVKELLNVSNQESDWDSTAGIVTPRQNAAQKEESDWDSTAGAITPRQGTGLGYKEVRPGDDEELSELGEEEVVHQHQPSLQPVMDQVHQAVRHIGGVTTATPTPRDDEERDQNDHGEQQQEKHDEDEDEDEDSDWDSDPDMLPSDNAAPVRHQVTSDQRVSQHSHHSTHSHHTRSADSDQDVDTETISEWEIERKQQKEAAKLRDSLEEFEDITDLTRGAKQQEEDNAEEEARRLEDERQREENERRQAEERQRQVEEWKKAEERKLREEAEEEQRQFLEQQRQEELKRKEREEEERKEREEELERQRGWEREEERKKEQVRREAEAALEEERLASVDHSSGEEQDQVDNLSQKKDDEDDFELSETDIPMLGGKTGTSQGEELKQENFNVKTTSAGENDAKKDVSNVTETFASSQTTAVRAQIQPMVRQQAVYAPPPSLPPTFSTSQMLKKHLQVVPSNQLATHNRMEDFEDEDSYASDNGNPDSPRAGDRPDVSSYYPNLLGSGAPSYHYNPGLVDDDALSYTSTEFETESLVGRSTEYSPFNKDMLLSMNMNDPTTLLKLQEHYRDQRRQFEQERNQKMMLDNKVKLLNTERTEFLKKIDSLTNQKQTLEQSKLDLEAKIRGLQYNMTEEEEKRRNAEVLLEKTKDQLNRKEEKYTSSVEEKQKAELERRNMVMDLRAINNKVKELEGEREELERQLEHERESRQLHEKISEEQSKLREQLQQEKAKAVTQLIQKSSSHTGESSDDGAVMEVNETLKAELFALQAEVERQRSRSKDENALLAAENEDLHNKIEELKNEIKLNEEALTQATMQYSVQIGTLKTDYNMVSSELEKEKSLAEKLEAELESQKTRLHSTTAEMEKSSQARNELERELQHLKEELRKETERKEVEVEKYRETNRELSDKLQGVDGKLNSLEKELNVANTSLLERTNQLKQTTHSLDSMKTSLDNMDANYKLEKDHTSKLQAKLETTQDKLSSTQHEVLNLKQQLESSRQAALQDASMDAHEKFNTMMTSLKTEHEKSREALEQKNTTLTETITRMREEILNAENRRSTLESDIRHNSQEYNELIRKLSHAEASLEMAQKLKEANEQERTQLKLEVERLQQKYQAAHDKSVESQARNSELVDRMERAEKSSLASSQQLLHTSANMQAFSKSKEEMEGSHQKLLLENTRLEAELKHQKENAERLQQDLKETNTVRKSLEELCSNLKSHSDVLQEQLGSDDDLDGPLTTTHTEKASSSVLQQEAEDSKGLWEQEVVSRSKLGLRLVQLDRQKTEAQGGLDEEKRKVRKAIEIKKVAESKLEAEREKSIRLEKEVATLKVHLKNAKRKGGKDFSESCVVNLNHEFDKERREMDEALSASRKQLKDLHKKLDEEADEKGRLLSQNLELESEVQKLRQLGTSINKIVKKKLKFESPVKDEKTGDSHGSGGSGGDIDLIRAELEAKYRQELNRKLEEVNRYLEDQARARDRLDISRGENESRLSIDKKRLEDENMDLKLKYEKALARCDTKDLEARRLKELYDSEMKWRMRLSDQLERATCRAGDYKSKLSSERHHRTKFITSMNNLNLSTISTGGSMDASRLNATSDDPLSNKLRAELDRSIAKHLEAAPHDDTVPVIRTSEKSVLDSSFAKSSAEYYEILKQKYSI